MDEDAAAGAEWAGCCMAILISDINSHERVR